MLYRFRESYLCKKQNRAAKYSQVHYRKEKTKDLFF